MTYAAGGFSLNAQGDSLETHHKPLSLPLDSVLVELASLLCEAPHKILKKKPFRRGNADRIQRKQNGKLSVNGTATDKVATQNHRSTGYIL